MPNASLKALPITPDDFIIPMIPAIAIAPIPIGRTYALKIISAVIASKGFVPPLSDATILPISFTNGIKTNHDNNEPTAIISEYLNPTR